MRNLMTWEWLRPRPFSRLKFLGYAGSTVPRFRMRPLSKLGLRLHPTCGRWRMYTAIMETAPSSSEARDVPKEAEVAGLKVDVATTTPDELTKESEPFGAAETSEGLNLGAPQKVAESTAEAQATHVEEPALLVEPLQAVPPGEGYKDLETTSTQLSKEGIKVKPKK